MPHGTALDNQDAMAAVRTEDRLPLPSQIIQTSGDRLSFQPATGAKISTAMYESDHGHGQRDQTESSRTTAGLTCLEGSGLLRRRVYGALTATKAENMDEVVA